MAEKVKAEDLTLHPTSRSHRFMSFSGSDVWYVIVVGGALYIASGALPKSISGWVTIIGGVLFLLSMIRSGRLNRRLYRVPSYFVRNWWRRKVRHYRYWTQPKSNSRAKPDEEEKKGGEQLKSLLPIRTVRFGDMGTVVNEKFRMITFIVRISGTNLSTKTISEQKAFHDKLAEALKFAVATVRRARPTIGMLYRSRNDNPYEYEKILFDLVDDRVLLPEAEKKPEEEWTEEDYINDLLHQVVVQEALEEIQSLVEPEMVFTFSVRYSGRLKKVLETAEKAQSKDPKVAQKAKQEVAVFEHKYLLKEPVARLRDAVVSLFTDIYTGDLEVLNFPQLIDYLRNAHDLDKSEYNLEAYLAEQRGETMPSTSWKPEGFLDTFEDKVNVNGSWHTTIHATQFPDEFAFPFTGREFYTPLTMTYTACTIGRITKGNHRYRFVQGASHMTDGAKDFFGVDKSGPKADKAQQQVYNNLAQLDKSGWAATYEPMMTVSKRSEQELEVAAAHVDSRLDGMFFGPQRVIGESVQWEEFFVASTGIPLTF